MYLDVRVMDQSGAIRRVGEGPEVNPPPAPSRGPSRRAIAIQLAHAMRLSLDHSPTYRASADSNPPRAPPRNGPAATRLSDLLVLNPPRCRNVRLRPPSPAFAKTPPPPPPTSERRSSIRMQFCHPAGHRPILRDSPPRRAGADTGSSGVVRLHTGFILWAHRPRIPNRRARAGYRRRTGPVLWKLDRPGRAFGSGITSRPC